MTALNYIIRAKKEYKKKFKKEPKYVLVGTQTNRELIDDGVSRAGSQLFGMKVIIFGNLSRPYCCGEDRIIYRYP